MDDGRLRFPIQRQAEQQSCRCKRRHPMKVRFKTIPAFCRNLFPAGTLTKLAHHLKQIEKEQDFDNPFSGLGQVLRAAKECFTRLCDISLFGRRGPGNDCGKAVLYVRTHIPAYIPISLQPSSVCLKLGRVQKQRYMPISTFAW